MQATHHPERRAWVRYPCDLDSFCQPTIGSDDMRWVARIADISRGGIRLIVERRFEPRTILKVEPECASEDAPASMLAYVVHVTVAGNRWALGCRLAKELSEKELQALLTPRSATQETESTAK
ncbi:MAG: hypothetical protein KatS3mg105_0043 [Gemmatales bacterium]|nr:MAG: hypothetical protein KatS3mg105_0043 [Gemmatales bacterium]